MSRDEKHGDQQDYRRETASHDESENLTPLQATRLIEMGLQRGRRPVDDVVQHLEREGGDEWLHKALTAVGCEALTSSAGIDSLGLDEITALKDETKRRVRYARTHEDATEAAAGYFTALAVALVRHESLISGEPAERVQEALLELASAAPPPWDALFADASLVAGKLATSSPSDD